jgi:hypothetical protein
VTIAIPDRALAGEATGFVRDTSTRLLFEHSRRVFHERFEIDPSALGGSARET